MLARWEGTNLIFNIDETNESGRLEVIDFARSLVRLDYSSGFYGSCSLSARLRFDKGSVTIEDDTLSVEEYDLKRGTYQGLYQSACRFLTSAVCKRGREIELYVRQRLSESASNGVTFSLLPSILWFDKK